MLPETTRKELRNKLYLRRKDIIEQNKRLHDVWQNIDFAAFEYQDRSQLETTSSSLGGLSQRQREELGIIDAALERIQQGTYGICTSCGEPIEEKRLQALPWAEHCTECKAREEKIRSRIEEPTANNEPVFFPTGDEAIDVSEYSDEELLELISERIEERGLLDMEGVEIECENGVIRLSGVVSSEMQREILLSLLQDELGIQEVDDELAVTLDPSRGEAQDLEDIEDIDETDENLLWPGDEYEEGPE